MPVTLVVALVLLGQSGCWTVLGLDDKVFTRGGGGAGQGGAGGGTGHPGMVRVEHGQDSFYVDATEVTNEVYAAWLRETPAPSPHVSDPRCAWNTSLQPGVVDGCPGPADPSCAPGGFDSLAAAHPREPVSCVDFCDAMAFCLAHHAHLCGGKGGATIEIQSEPGAFVSANSQWYFACSGGQGRKYPYGNTLDPAACNDGFDGIGGVVDVKTATCQGGFPGIYDMSGNVDEWVDACYPGDELGTSCVRAGGAYYSDGTPDHVLPDCDEVSTFARRCQNNSTGFRCCAD